MSSRAYLKKNVRSKVRIWAPSTSASVIIIILWYRNLSNTAGRFSGSGVVSPSKGDCSNSDCSELGDVVFSLSSSSSFPESPFTDSGPIAVISERISSLARILSRRAYSTLRTFPRRGSIA